MNLYSPICVVDESALEAIDEYRLVNRPDVIERADLLAQFEGKDLTVEHIRLAVKQMGIVH